MKVFITLLMASGFIGLYSCDRTNDQIGDDLSLERQEEYRQDNLNSDEVEVDRDILGDDEI